MSVLGSLQISIKNALQDYDSFLNYDPDKCESLKHTIKKVYDCLNNLELLTSPLPNFVVDNLDDEQIWQEIELDNKQSYPYILKKLSQIINSPEDQFQQPLYIDQINSDDDEATAESDFITETEVDLKNQDLSENSNNAVEESLFPSFNKIKKNKSHEDEIEYYGDSSDNEEKNISTKEKNPNFGNKSLYELQQEKLSKLIQNLESANVSEKKPWQMVGEICAETRPVNSLLEEYLQYSRATAPPPVITEESTSGIEGIILQRIKDKCWDDVQRKTLKGPSKSVADAQSKANKCSLLDDKKSQLSLSQVYEKDYLERQSANKTTSYNGEQSKEQNLPQIHAEIKDGLSKLFLKLDALCNFHYKPTLPEAEIRIVRSGSNKNYDPPLALNLEENTGIINSAETQIAPQEIISHKDGVARLGEKLEKLKGKESKKGLENKKSSKNETNAISRKGKKKRFDFVRRWQELEAEKEVNKMADRKSKSGKKKKSIHSRIGNNGMDAKKIKL